MQWNRLLRLVALTLVAVAQSGCVFYLLPTNPPQSRQSFAPDLLPESTERLEQWYAEVQARYPVMAPAVRHANEPLQGGFYYSNTFYWPLLAGTSRHLEVFLPAEGATGPWRGALLWSDRDTGFLAPVFTHEQGRLHDMSSGLCIASERSVSILMRLIYVHRLTKPTGPGYRTTSLECFPRGRFIQEMEYDQMESLSMGWGALAAGTKNGRPYFQIAWIPIPLQPRREP